MSHLVFIDECGDHNLKNIDPSQPIFCIAGVIFDKPEYQKKINEINLVKCKYFGYEGAILRSYNIRNCTDQFRTLLKPEIKQAFYADMLPVLASGYKVICVSVNKEKYKEKKGASSMNPYEICMGIFLERLGYFIKRESIPEIELIAESRGKKEDKDLFLAYENIINGTNKTFYHSDFKDLNIKLTFESKI